jgi:TrmH family RNA methyltransferase
VKGKPLKQPDTIKYITSGENPLIKEVLRLKQRKHREREGNYLIEGVHLLSEALSTGAAVSAVIFRDSSRSQVTMELEKLQDRLGLANVPMVALSDDAFDRLAETETPQGVIAIVARRDTAEESFFGSRERPEAANYLVLDRLQDPGNVGTVIRTADALGVAGVIVIKGTADVYNAKVVRAAAGSLFRMPLLFLTSGEAAIKLLSDRGIRLAVALPDGDKPLFQQSFAEGVALVIGNEGGGVSQAFRDAATLRVSIPMHPGVESLNVAVAAGILLYEAARQRWNKNIPTNNGG